MSAKKFEKLIDLIINEDQERANQLFHEIVVEKSREIYESIIDEDDDISGLMDEVSADEEGDNDEFDSIEGDEEFDDEDGEAEFGKFDSEEDEFDDEETDLEDLEDRVIDLEDKLDELMADFEAQLGGDDDEEEEFDDVEVGDETSSDEGDFDDEEDMGDEGDDEEAGLMEAAQLKQVGGKTYDMFGEMGTNGDQIKSPGLQNPTRIDNGGAPVKFSGTAESVPTSAKKPSNPYAKGEKTENAGNINVPGGNAGKTGFKTKAPAPKTETVKAKSPVAEARRTTKRRI
jgi:flagellar protein FlaE/flagellar protein FlaC